MKSLIVYSTEFLTEEEKELMSSGKINVVTTKHDLFEQRYKIQKIDVGNMEIKSDAGNGTYYDALIDRLT
jgi:hypothetical protein